MDAARGTLIGANRVNTRARERNMASIATCMYVWEVDIYMTVTEGGGGVTGL